MPVSQESDRHGRHNTNRDELNSIPHTMPPGLCRSLCYITLITLLCAPTPAQFQQQPQQEQQRTLKVGRPRGLTQPTNSSSPGPPADQRRSQVSANITRPGLGNNNLTAAPVSTRSFDIAALVSQNSRAGPGQPSPRIDTLDDISHRLDQTRENVSLAMDDTRVPFWNIAHMINSIEQVDLALGAGSNGVETDISFDATGRPTHAYHGVPCDCGRHCFHQEDLVKFVKYLAHITCPPAASRLFVVLLDLKLKDLKEPSQKDAAGRHLASLLHKHLYAPYQAAASYHSRHGLVQPPLRVVVSINHASDIQVVKSFIGYMRSNHLGFMSQQVGFDVGMNDNLAEISAAWDELRGATFNIWQGDGLTNCVNIVRGVDRLKQAISIRNDQGHFRKVYFWTADIMYHIRSVLRLGLDAILTNKPQRVNQVLNEPEFQSKYRLATAYDDPFQQFHIRPSSWSLARPSVGEIVETFQNIRETSSNFIKTIPDGLSAALNRVNHSIGLPSRS